MIASTVFTLPAVSFRHLETPFNKQGLKDYFAIVEVNNLPDLSKWRKINVRDPKLSGYVPDQIREGFKNPNLFVFMNRGIVLSVHSVSFDNQSKVLTLKMTDPNIHGLMDGGHTYKILLEERKEDEPQYVKLEILEGFGGEDIPSIVDARNTSNQVQDESLLNLRNKFDDLKSALKGRSYYDKIAWSEFEVDEENNPKPIDVREIIAILTAFDKDNFNGTTHPINSYRSKAACLNHFKNNQASYAKIYPLAKEILALYDAIQEELPKLYNKARTMANPEMRGGKFGRLTGVTWNNKPRYDLHFSGKKTQYNVPAGFVYPILGAFRAMLEEQDGRYVWGKKVDPIELLSGPLGYALAETVGNFALEQKNPSKTGKSLNVWNSCFKDAENAYLRMK
jgi:hypothetical protein